MRWTITLLRLLTLLASLAAIITVAIGTTALMRPTGLGHLLALPLTAGVGFLLIGAAWSPPRALRVRERARRARRRTAASVTPPRALPAAPGR
ncbi:hypothetical protein [Streptomyces sp. NPDC060194]|uniref:hypothetical protein n=1 Tax=Streptomyces sp. NPDC060194 TaxID=3347069 RepID=UPI003663CBFB